MTTTQLRLLTDDAAWKLDSDTRRIGHQGIAQARAALQRHAAASLAADDHTLAA